LYVAIFFLLSSNKKDYDTNCIIVSFLLSVFIVTLQTALFVLDTDHFKW
jgi:hypothetical protein